MDKQLSRDLYYLSLAKEVATRSKCMSRKIGAILVKNDSLISTGYNGPARGVRHCNERTFTHNDTTLVNPKECPRKLLGYKSGMGLHLCQASHAERNCILQAAKNGIATDGSTLYCFCPIPCKDCSIECINAGIKRIVCFKGEDYDSYSRIILKEAEVELVEIDKELLD